MAHYQSYIICTSPRSGSTLLCKLLQATGCSGLPDSHFHVPSLPAWLRDHGLADQDFKTEQEALQTVFKSARMAGTGGTGIFGLRLQRHSFSFFMEQLRKLYPDQPGDQTCLEAAFGPTLFIHLTRPNKLEQAISRVKAEQTGLWHRAADGSELERLSAPGEPVYDMEAITGHIAELTGFDDAWQTWFEQEGLTPLRISYEELSRAPASTLADILETLGLDRKIAGGITPPTAKLSDDLSRAWARRYLTETAVQQN